MPTPPKTRRRWFQFRLTMLFVLMTLVAVWLAWELSFIRERQAWLRENAALVDPDSILAANFVTSLSTPLSRQITGTLTFNTVAPGEPKESIPWWRNWLGDEAVSIILAGKDWTDDDHEQVVRLFPEAKIRPHLIFGRPISGATGTILRGPAYSPDPWNTYQNDMGDGGSLSLPEPPIKDWKTSHELCPVPLTLSKRIRRFRR